MDHQTERFLESLSALLFLGGTRKLSPETLSKMELKEVFDLALQHNVALTLTPLRSHAYFGKDSNKPQ